MSSEPLIPLEVRSRNQIDAINRNNPDALADRTSNAGGSIIQKIGETLTSWKESIQTTITRIITNHPKMTAAILGTIATASVIFGLAAGGILPIGVATIIFLIYAALYNFAILYA